MRRPRASPTADQTSSTLASIPGVAVESAAMRANAFSLPWLGKIVAGEVTDMTRSAYALALNHAVLRFRRAGFGRWRVVRACSTLACNAAIKSLTLLLVAASTGAG